MDEKLEAPKKVKPDLNAPLKEDPSWLFGRVDKIFVGMGDVLCVIVGEAQKSGYWKKLTEEAVIQALCARYKWNEKNATVRFKIVCTDLLKLELIVQCEVGKAPGIGPTNKLAMLLIPPKTSDSREFSTTDVAAPADEKPK